MRIPPGEHRTNARGASNQIILLQAQIASMVQQNKELRQVLPILEKRLEAMPALVKLADDLHEHAAIDFRVWYKLGDREFELFSSESVSSR